MVQVNVNNIPAVRNQCDIHKKYTDLLHPTAIHSYIQGTTILSINKTVIEASLITPWGHIYEPCLQGIFFVLVIVPLSVKIKYFNSVTIFRSFINIGFLLTSGFYWIIINGLFGTVPVRNPDFNKSSEDLHLD